MGKNKHKRFEENKSFLHLFQPSAEEMYKNDFFLKGNWNKQFFKNDHPIILEVGCGKGEYTTGLAQKHPENNYIGIDIKGPRLWRGCKTVQERNLKNVAFIRNKVEFLRSFFDDNEIAEIWITFPDPQPNKIKKRLTSARFLEMYSHILKKEGIINLKTDSNLFYSFTVDMMKLNRLEIVFSTNNLYNDCNSTELTEIKTYYEKQFLNKQRSINFLSFKIKKGIHFINPQ